MWLKWNDGKKLEVGDGTKRTITATTWMKIEDGGCCGCVGRMRRNCLWCVCEILR